MAAALPKLFIEIYRTMLVWDNEWLGYEAMANRTGYSVKELKDAVDDLEFYPGYIEYRRNRDGATGRILGSGYYIVPGKAWAMRRTVERYDERHITKTRKPTLWERITGFFRA